MGYSTITRYIPVVMYSPIIAYSHMIGYSSDGKEPKSCLARLATGFDKQSAWAPFTNTTRNAENAESVENI